MLTKFVILLEVLPVFDMTLDLIDNNSINLAGYESLLALGSWVTKEI